MQPAATGVNFTNFLAQSVYLTNQIFLNGSGVAAGDVDGDGWCDLYFTRLDSPNALYRNLGGWKFEEIAARAGVACSDLPCTGAAFADLDGDGDLDLIVNTIGRGTHVFANDGRGGFSQFGPPLNPGKGGMSMALADIDGDGDLDLYITNYRATTLRDMPNTRFRGKNRNGVMVLETVNGRPVTEPDLEGRFTLDAGGRVEEHGEVDALFRNDGTGRFTPVSFTDGTFLDEDGQPLKQPPYDWGLSVMFRDINGDGAPDLYVCNDFASPDRIWINEGRGQFRAIPRLAIRHTSTFSMGVDFADIDRDGHDDFFVAEMLARNHRQQMTQVADVRPVLAPVRMIEDRPQVPHQNTLFRSRGDGTFAEIAWFAGLAASDWSWAPVFLDVDLDGYEDLLITTGHELEMIDADVAERTERLRDPRRMSPDEQRRLRLLFPKLAQPNVAFRNRGNFTFEDSGDSWGFNQTGVSHGMALADLDNDGDLDIAVNNLNQTALLLRNDAPAPRVAVRLKGVKPNTQGIGAKIKVSGSSVKQSQEMISGGRYLSSDEGLRVFAAGGVDRSLTLEVTWRSGKTTRLARIAPNQIVEIAEPQAAVTAAPASLNPPPLFEDASSRLSHTHSENEFDDFARQPLLPRRLSQAGPGAAWFDLNGDGFDDLLFSSGQGGALNAFTNDGKGGFTHFRNPFLVQPVPRDSVAVLASREADGSVSLLLSESNWEDGLASTSTVRSVNFQTGQSLTGFPAITSSTGSLALGDVDGDGDLDLFIGGRARAGQYPEAAPSILLLRDGPVWRPDPENKTLLENAGLVNGAVWSDLTGDGFPELLLATEWGPVHVYKNERGKLVEATSAWGFSKLTGWWNGVNVGDFDGDGRLDIIACNWGLNSRYQASPEHPRRIYGQGAELLEARFDAESKTYVPDRLFKTVRSALPFVADAAPNHQAYSRATIATLLGARASEMKVREAATFASMVFLNRLDAQGQGRFEPVELPAEAQFAPAFAASVADFDGDGHEDVFLSQNFFAMNSETSRQDAGQGLLLRGSGSGKFTPMTTRESGILIHGEQRAAAVADFDRDGRCDLAVTQNGALTRLFRNAGARPGLRVSLEGPPGNPLGIGAVLRVKTGNQSGPAREIHAGSGYVSQDSAVQVLSIGGGTTGIEIQWPGGRRTLSNVPVDAREISINVAGQISVIR